jgi:hypothetical protein
MKLRDFLNNFNDAGKTIIDLYFSGITFKISVGYNHIEVDTKEWKELIDVFGDKEVYSWDVDIYKKSEYSEYPRIEARCR